MPRAAQPSSLGLRRIELLDALSLERLDALARQCAWRNYGGRASGSSRATLSNGTSTFLVRGGCESPPTRRAGRQVTFRDMSAGEVFGEMAGLDEMPRSPMSSRSTQC